jgi:hypothetical protein
MVIPMDKTTTPPRDGPVPKVPGAAIAASATPPAPLSGDARKGSGKVEDGVGNNEVVSTTYDPRPQLPQKVPETGGPAGPEPTRYGDWERKGRCIDF